MQFRSPPPLLTFLEQSRRFALESMKHPASHPHAIGDEAMIYFDTDAFRRIGSSLGDSAVPDEICQRIAISPITASEVMSQLTITHAGKILDSIKAMKQWLPPTAPILDWPDDFILSRIIGKDTSDQVLKTVGKSLNVCLQADNPDEIKGSAKALKDVIDHMKLQQATRDQGVADRMRGKPIDWSEDLTFFAKGVAQRVGAALEPGAERKVSELLSAYFEYGSKLLRTAVGDPNFSFLKKQNSALDAEQLVYLADPELHFVTLDGGFSNVTKSPQKSRIHILGPDMAKDSRSTIEKLGEIIRI
jgi:hypothetical protein